VESDVKSQDCSWRYADVLARLVEAPCPTLLDERFKGRVDHIEQAGTFPFLLRQQIVRAAQSGQSRIDSLSYRLEIGPPEWSSQS
jgi:hypothetical protein